MLVNVGKYSMENSIYVVWSSIPWWESLLITPVYYIGLVTICSIFCILSICGSYTGQELEKLSLLDSYNRYGKWGHKSHFLTSLATPPSRRVPSELSLALNRWWHCYTIEETSDIISSFKASQMLWNKLFSPSFWNQAYQARSISATNTVPSSTWWVQDLSIAFGCHQSGPYCISQATLLCLSQVTKHQSQVSWGSQMEYDDKAQAWWHIGQRACDSPCCQRVCISIY